MSEYETDGNDGDGGEYECPICQRRFSGRRGVGKHMGYVHGITLNEYESQQGEYPCPYEGCPKAFDGQHAVNVHHQKTHGDSISGVELSCERCGEPYTVLPYRVDASRFCSRQCQNETLAEVSAERNRDRVSLTCGWCGSQYDVQSYREGSSDYCSHHCRAKQQSSEQEPERFMLVCEVCGGDFGVIESRKEDARFCSASCRGTWWSNNFTGEDHWNWEGGKVDYGPGWNLSKKERVRNRDGRECVLCSRSEQEHMERYGERHTVHHIRPAREVDDPSTRNALDNLITLCRGCHNKVERLAPFVPSGVNRPSNT